MYYEYNAYNVDYTYYSYIFDDDANVAYYVAYDVADY